MIQIQEDKAEELKELAKKMLKNGKKLYECIEGLCEESSIGERGGYGNRYGSRGGSGSYGNRMGYREDWDDEDDFGERRGARGMGRYSRYR